MKGKRVIGILATVFLTFSSGWTTFATSNTVAAKRYIIKFKTTNVNGSKFISKYSGKLRRQFKNIPEAVADITPQNASELKKNQDVAYVEEDHVVRASSTTFTNWGVSDIGAPVSWQSGLTGKGVKIAIVDTGVANHSDLVTSGGTNVISGSLTTSYTDDNGHGTHVAGVIGAKGFGTGVKGVAPDAAIYAVKALDSTGSGYTSDIIAGIDWAIQNKMDIISMSLGTSQSDTSLQNAVDAAYNAGILVVAAAGNDGNSSGTGDNVEYPAKYSSVIAVGAVDSTNSRASFSSTGSKVEVSAPGVNVLSTYLNGSYAQMSGTSAATPFVAGDLALLKQKYPSYTNVQLRQLLDGSSLDLGASGRDYLYGFGLIQAPSLTAATEPSTQVPSISPTPIVIPTPTSNAPTGTYRRPMLIQLYDKYRIFYTLDGSTPTAKSLPYRGYININVSCNLKAIAVDSSGNTSQVLNRQYNIVKSSSSKALTKRNALYMKIYSFR